ncbi:TraR/DksA family transcriptional regulator [Streptomyces megasporus]|uniref:TraR/DksA family transcriptional regulator n=1 Tax=Streptomyces megasporus TaxID=44060 RepID=UPI0004E11EB9|nr:TraR/DksA C4-type zinc finger protein [Streptomyces megasporus]
MNNQVAGAVGAALTPRELATLRDDLEEQRRFRIDQLREFSRAREEPHTAGRTEVEVRIVASARMVLADVEEALERMDRGHYGVCLRCARPVPFHLLEIVPQARYCAPCRQSGEAGR